MPYRPEYRTGYVVSYGGWPGYGFFDPYLFGYPDWYNDDNAGSNGAYDQGMAYAGDGGGAEPSGWNDGGAAPEGSYGPGESGQELARGVRAPYVGGGADAPEPAQAVTVIFKDGRSATIHNYLLTATTLTVLDERYHEIPLDEINLGATADANRAEGIEFRVPRVTQ